MAGKRGTLSPDNRRGPYFTAISGGYRGLRHQAPEDTPCGVITLDLDDADAIDPAFLEPFGAHVIWRTFRSTLQGTGQRWRAVLFVDGVTVGNYRSARNTLTRITGIGDKAANYGPDHPMFVPVLFEGENVDDIIVHRGIGKGGRAWQYRGETQATPQTEMAGCGEAWATAPDFSRAESMEVLWSLDPDASYDEWYALGGAFKLQAQLGGWSDVGREAWVRWSRCGKKGQDGSAEEKWDTQLGGHHAPATLRRWHGSGGDAPNEEKARDNAAKNLSIAFPNTTTPEQVGALMAWMGFGDAREEGFACGGAVTSWAETKGWRVVTDAQAAAVIPQLVWGQHLRQGWFYAHPEPRYAKDGLVGVAKDKGWLKEGISDQKGFLALRRTVLKTVANDVWEPAQPILFETEIGTTYNFFRPFAPGLDLNQEHDEWDSLLYDHLHTIVTENWEEEKGRWLLGWMRHVLLCPGNKSMVIPVLQSGQGAGKGTLYRLMAAAIGRNATSVSTRDSGYTNSYYRKVLVCFQEFPTRPPPALIEWIKDCATSDVLDHNLKYGSKLTENSYLNLMVHTNEISLDLYDPESRRFCCLKSNVQRLAQRSQSLIDACNVLNTLLDQDKTRMGSAVVRLMRKLPATFTPGVIPGGFSDYEEMKDTADAEMVMREFLALENGAEKGDNWITGSKAQEILRPIMPELVKDNQRFSHAMRDAGFEKRKNNVRKDGRNSSRSIWYLSDHPPMGT